MGYRSQVVLAISKELTPFFMMKLAQCKEAEELVFKHADTFDRDYGGDKSWLLTGGTTSSGMKPTRIFSSLRASLKRLAGMNMSLK